MDIKKIYDEHVKGKYKIYLVGLEGIHTIYASSFESFEYKVKHVIEDKILSSPFHIYFEDSAGATEWVEIKYGKKRKTNSIRTYQIHIRFKREKSFF